MNQSYRPCVRVGSVRGSGQPEPGPINGLLSTSCGNQFAPAKPGSDHLSALQLQSPSVPQPAGLKNSPPNRADCYGPLKRVPDLSRVFFRTDASTRDLDSRAVFDCASPISDAEFDAPSVLLPPSPGSDDVEPLEPLQDVDRNEFSHGGLGGLGRCSPLPNGYLHFGSTLFDNSDIKAEEAVAKEDLAPFYHSSRSNQGQTVSNAHGSRADKRTYKPTLFNLMSKTISELNPTLSPSALPEITMRDGWSLAEDCDSDGELDSPIDPGLFSPIGTKSNVSLVRVNAYLLSLKPQRPRYICAQIFFFCVSRVFSVDNKPPHHCFFLSV